MAAAPGLSGLNAPAPAARPALRLRLRTLATVFACSLGLPAAAKPPEARPAKVDPAARAGLDPARLARIAPRMQELVDAQRVAGVVTLVARKGVVAHHEAVGLQDLESRTPMRKDTIFQIMSMTKPVTGLAIMMLAEDGRLGLLDPVERHLPEFKGIRVAVRRGESGPGAGRLVEPARPFTIRDLMTHTSGMGDYPPEMEVYTKMDRSLEETIRATAKLPLLFEPGEGWSYSNPGIATLGRIVEVVSGKPYEEFLKERLLQPLGLQDTFLFPPPEKTARIALVYRVEAGRLERSPATILGGDAARFRAGAKYPAPDFALYSTASDLFRIHQMVLDEGVFEGRRYLSPTSIRLMSAVHTGSLELGGREGSGFGLTYEVVRNAAGTLRFRSPGTFGHGGAFGTDGWIDPTRRLVTLLLIQRSGGAEADERTALAALAASAVVD